ncbi:Tfp pilus assembly protein PilV [Legionella lansingensis]|uniref:Tfp pilus assembly protein PilV n=1 Tax=Legionella lansingensis TaxID=45067 RepID=A0A0W0W0G1_9GAMM|nr:hypothetical protein [Legionella lansingensis]KTD25786.1 hypothetical protein Llan_0055 [Legionella lansingensis]SNV52155.1 Tfp pilus assembly protein PilV [Legionella lansingensis]
MKIQGFSFLEVLVSLILVTSVSLALLQQQLQVSQFLQRALQRAFASTLLDNNSERVLARQPLAKPQNPYELTKTEISQGLILSLAWGFEPANSGCCQLQRSLITR